MEHFARLVASILRVPVALMSLVEEDGGRSRAWSQV
jgi:hypothetical protein